MYFIIIYVLDGYLKSIFSKIRLDYSRMNLHSKIELLNLICIRRYPVYLNRHRSYLLSYGDRKGALEIWTPSKNFRSDLFIYVSMGANSRKEVVLYSATFFYDAWKLILVFRIVCTYIFKFRLFWDSLCVLIIDYRTFILEWKSFH